MKFTILGCGSSGGVPRLGGKWGACDPDNPKNTRTRCSLLVERIGKAGTTRLLIDTSPDMRAQLLNAGIGHLDGVIYTHEHADHLHGIDDLRMIVLNRGVKLPVYANERARKSITNRFGYVFQTPKGSSYPPILEMNPLEDGMTITGAGGPININCFEVQHGNITATAIKIAGLLYTPDISALDGVDPAHLSNLRCWIIDALRIKSHPSHFNLEQALEAIKAHKPQDAILTNLHIDLDYKALQESCPKNVRPAYDGLDVELPLV